MPDEGFRAAVLPLFEAGHVELLEWSFELGWTDEGESEWVSVLLDHYADSNALWGHGVTMSLLSADAPKRHDAWLKRVEADCSRRSYRGVSEHYGFMGNDDDDAGAPLPMPVLPEMVNAGRQALRAVSKAAAVPVGLENLALALTVDDVWAQGPALELLLDAVDGYLVLDLHNVYCQAVNFAIDPVEIIESLPVSRARCLHVSGGSWSDHPVGRFRRDTHDGGVPTEVFALVKPALQRCAEIEAVVLERIGSTVHGEAQAAALRDDFNRLRREVRT